jgi:hypothetical protein
MLAFTGSGVVGLPAIGAPLGGGFFAGQISTAANGVADYNLVVGPRASAELSNTQWKTTQTATAGTSSVIDGPTNSSNMNNASHPAAQFCEGLTIGGFSDWYMPAKNELEVLYYNLKPTTGSNQTSSGINANAVPPRAENYTSGDPPQTSATAFINITGSEYMNPSNGYWSSSENSTTQAWIQIYSSGQQLGFLKDESFLQVRAVRRIPV